MRRWCSPLPRIAAPPPSAPQSARGQPHAAPSAQEADGAAGGETGEPQEVTNARELLAIGLITQERFEQKAAEAAAAAARACGVVGCVELAPLAGGPFTALLLSDLAVAPHARRRGVGAALVAAAVAAAREAGAALVLEVSPDNAAARALYAAAAFAPPSAAHAAPLLAALRARGAGAPGGLLLVRRL